MACLRVSWPLEFLHHLRVHAVLEYMDIDALNFAKAPSSHRGAEGRWRCLRLLVASFSDVLHQMVSPWSLYSDSSLSSRLQPLGSDGDVTPCEDTREDFGLSFLLPATTFCCRVAFKCQAPHAREGRAKSGRVVGGLRLQPGGASPRRSSCESRDSCFQLPDLGGVRCTGKE